jgi:hypothetical protein
MSHSGHFEHIFRDGKTFDNVSKGPDITTTLPFCKAGLRSAPFSFPRPGRDWEVRLGGHTLYSDKAFMLNPPLLHRIKARSWSQGIL